MPTIAKRRNAAPEYVLQGRISKYLKWALPSDILWTASMAGVKMSPMVAMKARASGLRRGFPDLMFLFPSGVTRYLEVKAPGGVLTPEQKVFAQHCQPHGIFAVCRSVSDVEKQFLAWGVTLRPDPFDPATYET